MQVLKLFRNFEILFEGKTCHNLPERQNYDLIIQPFFLK